MNPCFIIDAQTNKVCRMASLIIIKKSSLSAAAATSALLPSGANALILPFSNVDSPPSRAPFSSSSLPAGSCAACTEAGGRAGSGARDLLPFWRRRRPPPQVASPARRAGGGDGRFAHLIAARRRNLLRVARTRVPARRST